jgi:hypothetical protein
MSAGSDSSRPSDALRKSVLVNLGSQVIAKQKAAATAATAGGKPTSPQP